VRRLVKDGFIIRKPEKIHSRHRARTAAEAKAKGRHTGYGALACLRLGASAGRGGEKAAAAALDGVECCTALGLK